MKKAIVKAAALLATAATAFALCACGETGGNANDPDTNRRDERVYNNVQDFSSLQGWNGWHYLYRDAMGEIYKMTFDLDGGRWNGRDFYCYNSPTEQHPGNNTETIIGWKATVNGKVQVTGSVTRNPADWSGDGVFYYVTLNEEEDDYLFSPLIEPLEKTPYEMEFEADVKAGDMLYFCINLNANNSFDSTQSNITIQYKY